MTECRLGALSTVYGMRPGARVASLQALRLPLEGTPGMCPHSCKSTCKRKTRKTSRPRGMAIGLPLSQSLHVTCSTTVAEQSTASDSKESLGNVEAVLFDMDGVLCNSEKLSQSTAVRVLEELYGIKAEAQDFVPFAGMGEANFLGGVGKKYGVQIDIAKSKKRFFEIYLAAASDPNYKIGYPGAVDLVRACQEAGLKTAVASSADRVKVDANLLASGFDAANNFDVIISADKFELLKPAPDIFLAAAQALGIQPDKCIVVEDAPAGVQAAKAAGMRCIGVTTSIPLEDMRAQSPDAVFKDIGHIGLESVLSLQKLQANLENGSQHPSGHPDHREAGGNWLDQSVDLPGNYKTKRRELLKFLPLLGFMGTAYALFQNQKALTYVSPKALVNAFLPPQKPPQQGIDDSASARIAAFERYIADKERRGSMQAVPDFPAGVTWFNSSPLSLSRELRGKVLIYDFWTYCCINCIHILPALSNLEQRYSGQAVAIVGIHSAKFDNEKDDESIRNAIMRYEIRHPCVNDGNMTLWRELGISSWPTLAVVSPTGKLIASLPGEGQEEVVDSFIQAALSYYGRRDLLDNSSLPIALEQDKDSRLTSSPLRFPGKLATDLAGNRLFISDSNNNRIVITDLQGKYIDHIGGNGPLLKDGSFDEAAFNRPQGLAFSAKAGALYVADTENHALRKVDLSSKRVETLAGNGQKGSDYVGGGRGRNQQLNSPWDVAFDPEERALFIALAGQHQIWKHTPSSGVTEVFSGDGSERNANGGSGLRTSWAQPSGLSLSSNGAELIVADSESSAIRSMSLQSGGSQAIVGGDPVFSDNLFRFGNVDGQGSDAKLQHPLAVCSLGGSVVLVADSYNHQLKMVNTSRKTIKTLAGRGNAGFADGAGAEASLSEPSGLARGLDDTVFVADTNNHLVRVLEPSQGKLRTLQLQGVPPPRKAAGTLPDTLSQSVPPGAVLVRLDPITSSNGHLKVVVRLPERHHLTKGANSRFEIKTPNYGAVAFEPASGPLTEQSGDAAAEVQFRRSDAAEVQLNATIYYCLDGGVCLFHEVVFQLQFLADCKGESSIALDHTIPDRPPQETY